MTDNAVAGASQDHPTSEGADTASETELNITVTFLQTKQVARWDGKAESLLEFAERQGLSPPFCCRAGVCNTCATRIVRGSIVYFTPPVSDPAPGEILLCCSRPAESVEIDI